MTTLAERYEVVRTLGQGASGQVMLARDTRLGREVAVKLLAERTPEQVALFESEAKTMAALEHEHIVRVYDYGFAEGQPYLVMELVRGTSLYARLAAERPRIADAVKIARQILAGVGAAHAGGVVHRDLKPGNIFLDESGRVKVGDFGLALSPHAPAHAGTVMGTPSYMAPEQMNGAAVTPAADVFSIGLILHEMLTGQRVYPGNDPVQVFTQRMRHTPTPPSKLDPLVPAALDQVVLRALAPDAAERATAAEISDSLAHWLERERRDAHAGAVPARAYKLLEHFGPEDAPIFFGREAETNDLLELVDHPRVRMLMIFGRCGIGKSSLLRAGLIAGLDRGRLEPLLVISGPDPARSVRDALATRAAQAGVQVDGDLALKPTLVLELMARLEKAIGRTPVILVDQLEELFTQNPRGSPRIADFFCLAERLVEAQTLKVKLALSFRAEFRGDFFPLEERLGPHLRSFAVREMDVAGLETAIESPSRIPAYGFRYAPGFARDLAREIASARDHEGAALPVLQIICAQLVEHARQRGQVEIDRALYETALGGARGALSRWVAERLASPHYAYQGALARQILRGLTIKEEGKERFACARDEDELLDFPDRAEARVTLERLITDQLVVRDVEGGKRRVRLASEVVCPLVESWDLAPDEVEKASRNLAASCRQWAELGRQADHLLPAASIGLISKHLGAMKGVTELEREYLAASLARRRRILIAITCFNMLWIVETGLIGIFPRPYLIDRAISGVCALFGVAY